MCRESVNAHVAPLFLSVYLFRKGAILKVRLFRNTKTTQIYKHKHRGTVCNAWPQTQPMNIQIIFSILSEPCYCKEILQLMGGRVNEEGKKDEVKRGSRKGGEGQNKNQLNIRRAQNNRQ